MVALDRKDIRNTFIFITVVLVLVEVFNLFYRIMEINFRNTYAPLFVIVLAWISYFYQSKTDKNPKETIGGNAFETYMKVGGAYYKFYSVVAILGSVLIFIGGILTLLGIGSSFQLDITSKLVLGFFAIIMGVVVFIIGIYLWQRGSVGFSGRLYKKPQQSL